MDLKIGELNKKDYKKAIDFAISGMHFDWYLKNKFLLNLYGKYFLYSELIRATKIIAAYNSDKLMGILLAQIKGECKKYRSFFKWLYVRIFDFLQKLLYKNGAGAYEEATKELLNKYLKNNNPDGEILFLASDQNAKIKGIGSFLLSELEKQEKGKQIFLYTDNGCTYQFYEHRGFERIE